MGSQTNRSCVFIFGCNEKIQSTRLYMFKVWTVDQQHQQHLCAYEKCRIWASPGTTESEPTFKHDPQGTCMHIKIWEAVLRRPPDHDCMPQGESTPVTMEAVNLGLAS